MDWILRLLFPCRHKRTTFPLSPDGKKSRARRMYIVCLDCGREFDYDWSEMRIGPPVDPPVSSPVTKEAI